MQQRQQPKRHGQRVVNHAPVLEHGLRENAHRQASVAFQRLFALLDAFDGDLLDDVAPDRCANQAADDHDQKNEAV